jgi:hypothetical protein
MNDNFTREEDKLIRELGEQNLQFKREVEKRNYIIRKQQEELMVREILIWENLKIDSLIKNLIGFGMYLQLSVFSKKLRSLYAIFVRAYKNPEERHNFFSAYWRILLYKLGLLSSKTLYRIKRRYVLAKPCYYNGSCLECGCKTPELFWGTNACKGGCYPSLRASKNQTDALESNISEDIR